MQIFFFLSTFPYGNAYIQTVFFLCGCNYSVKFLFLDLHEVIKHFSIHIESLWFRIPFRRGVRDFDGGVGTVRLIAVHRALHPTQLSVLFQRVPESSVCRVSHSDASWEYGMSSGTFTCVDCLQGGPSAFSLVAGAPWP